MKITRVISPVLKEFFKVEEKFHGILLGKQISDGILEGPCFNFDGILLG